MHFSPLVLEPHAVASKTPAQAGVRTADPDPRVEVACLSESNGRKTWYVSLYRAGAGKFDGFSVYSSESEGRARYHAEEYKHFFGQAPKPDILKFDSRLPDRTTPPAQTAEG